MNVCIMDDPVIADCIGVDPGMVAACVMGPEAFACIAVASCIEAAGDMA